MLKDYAYLITVSVVDLLKRTGDALTEGALEVAELHDRDERLGVTFSGARADNERLA